MRKPTKLARLVAGIVEGSDLPVTVKIRTGENESKVNAAAVAEMMEAAGAAAVTIHGRTMEQRWGGVGVGGGIAGGSDRSVTVEIRTGSTIQGSTAQL